MSWTARISAKYLPVIAPFRGRLGETIAPVHAIRIEPHPDGGAMITATDGRVMGTVHDASARASGAATVQIPEALVAACRRPRFALWAEGEELPMQPPSWMIPDTVMFSDAGAFVCSCDEQAEGVLYSVIAEVGRTYRDDDYRVLDDWQYPAWASVYEQNAPTASGPININPALLARFSAAGGVDHNGEPEDRRQDYGLTIHQLADRLLVRSAAMPEFVGSIMLMRAPNNELRAIPDWLPVPCRRQHLKNKG